MTKMGEERQYLKHGKALCGKVFAKFVETFNWLVDFSKNMRGDGDAGGCGKIIIDRKDENHPVIRCKGCLEEGEGEGKIDNSCFSISSEEEENGNETVTVLKLKNCYYTIGGVMKHMEDVNLSSLIEDLMSEDEEDDEEEDEEEEDIVFVCLKLTGYAHSVVLIDEDELVSEQNIMSNYVRPLYAMKGGVVEADLRNAPQLQVWEYDQPN